ncbi:MAG: YraN family protein [Chthonomonas sp.]|nr:YraN family protein [Chthonomonas sp.]
MPHPRKLGTEAEDLAAHYLADKGMTVLKRRYKSGAGEADLVALDGQTLVFVEVKSTRSATTQPEARVTGDKVRRLTVAAHRYIAETEFSPDAVRFDLVTVTPDGINHIAGSFWGSDTDR